MDRDKIHKILVVRTDRVGEALLNIPAMRALKQSFNSYIVALLKPAVKELLTGILEIDEVLPYDEENCNRSISARLELLGQIRKKRFDLAVILNPTKRFHILTFLAGIPRRLGYNRKWGFLLTNKIEDRKSLGQKHEVEYNLDLVRSIGADTDDLDISIPAHKSDTQFIQRLLKEYGIKEQDLVIAIHPYASNPAKCWPQENFAQLLDKLHSRFAAKIRLVIIGGREEQDAAIKLTSLIKCPLINLTGTLTLKQLAGFFQRCVLLISNDSGPVHIAAASGVRTVVIFGRNIPGVSPKRWRPWGAGHIVLHKDAGCSQCLDRECAYNFKCLTSITPEEVIRVAEKFLNRDENINS